MGALTFVNHVHLALRSLNCDGRRGLALLAACLLLLLPTLGGDAGEALLRYERSALASGQWWRKSASTHSPTVVCKLSERSCRPEPGFTLAMLDSLSRR